MKTKDAPVRTRAAQLSPAPPRPAGVTPRPVLGLLWTFVVLPVLVPVMLLLVGGGLWFLFSQGLSQARAESHGDLEKASTRVGTLEAQLKKLATQEALDKTRQDLTSQGI